jgi:hypothetical protein
MTKEGRKGSAIVLSPARKAILEILRHARHAPSLPLSRAMQLPDLVAARNAHPSRPSWIAIFMKAYGLVAQAHPELRRALIPWPRPHLYEHPHSECALLVERVWQGEPVVLAGKVRAPEKQPLELIGSYLRYLHSADVPEVSAFRQLLRLGRLPSLVRRFAFWRIVNLSGYRRARRLGTFVLSSLGNYGVEQHHPLSPLTTYVTFGPISPEGDVTVKIVYDHRVMDGRTVARCLVDLEATLRNDLVSELTTRRRQPVRPSNSELVEERIALCP